MKHTQTCDTKDCTNTREIEWDGGYIEDWVCEDCRFKFADLDDIHGERQENFCN